MTRWELRALRFSSGLSVRSLARRVGVSERTWRRWEAGSRPLTNERAARVRAALPAS